MRPAGGTRREQHRRWLVGREARNLVPVGAIAQRRWILDNRQVTEVAILCRRGVDEAVNVGVIQRELVEHTGRVVRRQQVDLATAECRGEADREAVAVAAQIDDMAARREQRGKPGDIGQESLHGDRGARPMSEDGPWAR